MTSAETTAATPDPPRAARFPRRGGWLLRTLAAAAGGALVYLATPPRNLWWLAPLGVAALCLVLHGRRARAGFGYGVAFGLGWMLPLLVWLWDFLGPGGFGPWPWLGLSLAESLLVAVPCAIAAVVSELRLAPIWIAATFVLGEAIRDRVPFGGFPWGRLGFTQPSGPLLPLASLAGTPLLTFAVALAGAGLASLWFARHSLRRLVSPAAAVLLPVLLGLALLPTIGNPEGGRHARIAAIQGSGPNIGINLNEAGDVLWRRTVQQSARTLKAIHSGELRAPDLVLLPETVLAVRDTSTEGLAPVTELARAFDAPTVAGATVVDKRENTVLGIDPRRGQTGEYAKQHLVPFGETVPLRWLARLVTPFVDQMADLHAGDRPGVIKTGKARVGVGICYDVAYDNVLRGSVRHGANLLTVPTNNAWYGHSEMTYQQQAMARIRAVEHDRAVVVSATTGSSAIVRPDGTLKRQTGQFTPATMTGEVPLRTHVTLADTLGAWPEWVLSALGLLGLLFGIRARGRMRRGGEAGGADARAGG